MWEGNQPISFNLPLIFYALRDPLKEVTTALAKLEEIASPEVSANFLGGRIPRTFSLNIGRTVLMTDCIINSITTDISQERSSDGHLIHAEVQLSITKNRMMNGSDIAGSWGL